LTVFGGEANRPLVCLGLEGGEGVAGIFALGLREGQRFLFKGKHRGRESLQQKEGQSEIIINFVVPAEKSLYLSFLSVVGGKKRGDAVSIAEGREEVWNLSQN